MSDIPSETTMWQAVVTNDRSYDGQFVLAVKTTGIYCRPVCPARLPKRENVEFFQTNSEAENNGYRACKRCKPDQLEEQNPQAALIEAVCRYIDENAIIETITLQQLGDQFQHSPFHLQRTFKAVMGITPKQYADSVRMQAFKTQLQDGDTVTDAIYAAGYSSNSRLYERAAAQMGMIPSVYQQGGDGMIVAYAVADSPLGLLLTAATERGLCAVRLGDDRTQLVAGLHDEFAKATLVEDASVLQEAVQAIVQHLAGDLPDLDLPLDIQATAFQKQVWQALRNIPYGETRSYGEVATAINAPKSARAVGNACANNPVALVVPCHRVVKSNGELGNYRWGIQRKKQLIKQERQQRK
jgi:AraC family transcriptional regulator, regulatory protein of adaptative response / methylated-DNA-[protein]-cysteine methyltransferase